MCFAERPLRLVEQNTFSAGAFFFKHRFIHIYIAKFTFWEYYII